YPRRALNLHAAARIVTQRHGGQVPASHEDLLALPGVGRYTAAAVASFAFGQRHAVLDTNVRRVLSRLVGGDALPPRPLAAAGTRLAESLLPAEPAVAAHWAVAVMELGALVCTAASPRCGDCPVARDCAWLSAGRPAEPGGTTGTTGAAGAAGAAGAVRRRTQTYAGTDRQWR